MQDFCCLTDNMFRTNEKLKVCHLTSAHDYNDERIYLKECSALVDSGYKTHLVAPAAPNEVSQGIHLHSVPKVEESRLLRMTRTVWNVYEKALVINADIYHFHDPELIPVGLALKAKGKRVIYDVHEDVPRQILSKSYISDRFRSPLSVAIENLEDFASKRFDGIVTATPFIRDRFLQFVANAIDINNFPLLGEFYTPETSWEQKERAVCYAGGIWPKRGIFEMVEAIGLTNAQLLLAGAFAIQKERIEATEMGGWVNVQELGQVSRETVAHILAKSMAGLVLYHPEPNHINSQPNKLFEYMSAGIPVIASHFPLWKQIVEFNECGICVDPENPKAIAEAIQWFVDHPLKAKQMGERGRRAVEEKYNWANEKEKLVCFYQKILSNENL